MIMSNLEMTKNGITVDVRVNTAWGGRFEATVGDDQVNAMTWQELEKLVDKATKKVSKSVDVPFTSVRFNRKHTGEIEAVVRNGSATGLHSSNGHVLVKWTKTGAKEQLTGWNDSGTQFRPLTNAEYGEYNDLFHRAEEAKRLVREWEDEHKIDLKKAVIEVLNEGASPAS